MDTSLLGPASVLVIWSIVMLFWLAGARGAAVSKVKIDASAVPRGVRGQDIEPQLPPSASWASHNYTHLMEQPTLFYATVMFLTLAGAGGGINTGAAWGYVALRIVHSVWQATGGAVPVRFALFLASTICLVVMAINAVIATI